jgi:UDP-N-acetylmuramate: L-alanyl-gamma-D-glutamyl-meso-diaminopimelate ligase
VKRRMEVRGEERGLTVLDDFAHHPTAVRETLAATIAAYPNRRVIAVFEPRSNTSRRAVFQKDYVDAFTGAARVEVLEVSDAPIYSATGDDFERLSAERLCQDMRSRNQHSYAFGSVAAIIEDILREYKEGDVVLVMSNGDFDNIHERLLAALRELPAA